MADDLSYDWRLNDWNSALTNNKYPNTVVLNVSSIELCHEGGKIVCDVLGTRCRLAGADEL